MTDRSKALATVREHGMATIDRNMLLSGDGLQDKMNQLGAGATAGAILKFSGNTGLWTFKDHEFDYGTRMAFNLEYVEWGYVCWKGGKIIDRTLVPMFAGVDKPVESDLTDYGPYEKQGDGWKEAFRCNVIDLEDGTEYELTLSNKSGWNAMSALVKDFGGKARLHTEEDGSFKTPIVELSGVAFESKHAAGKKHAPKFRITDWYSKEDMMQVVGGVEALEEDFGDEPVSAPAVEEPKGSAVRKPTGNRRPRVVS